MRSSCEGNTPLVLGLLVALLVVVNIVITAIILGRPMTPNINVNSSPQGQQQQQPPPPPAASIGSGMSSSGGKTKERIYLLSYGHDYGVYEYIDNGGYHRGFFLELTKEVCKAAGVKCKLVFDKYSNCWESQPGLHPILGTGLQARYYDGCLGWVPTVERIHAAMFSLPFLSSGPAKFFYRKNEPINLRDFSGQTVGFIDGWASSEKCVARELSSAQGIPLKTEQIKHYVDPLSLAEAIKTKEVSMGFASAIEMTTYLTSHRLQESDAVEAMCNLAGNAVLCRVDSDLPEVWNRGFVKIFSNGRFKELCQKAAEDHAHRGNISCVDSFSYDTQ